MSPETSFVSTYEEQAVNVYVVDPDRRVSLDTIQGLCEHLYPDEYVVVHAIIWDRVNVKQLKELAKDVRLRMQNFRPEQDRMIVIGRSMANFMVGLVTGLLGISSLTLLIYDHDLISYREERLELGR